MSNDEMIKFESPFQDIEYDTYGCGNYPKSLLELNIMAISSAIRLKKDWTRKVCDPTITKKWKKELEQMNIFKEFKITAPIIDYIFDELRYHVSVIDSDNIRISSVDGVYESVNQIPENIRLKLDAELAKFEELEDWHPGSNKQVLDLIHPSMYCYVNGVSLELEDKCTLANLTKFMSIGQNQSDKNPEEQDEKTEQANNKDYAVSKKYQWLPCDVYISAQGDAQIKSYINNTHPLHDKDLYETIESILPHFIPMFEKVLTSYANPQPNRITLDPYNWYKNEPTDDDDDFYEDWYDNRIPEIPIAINDFKAPQTPINVQLKDRNLQIIVKAANIILTPEHSDYPGGVWHIEGMKNESIVATGIYYYYNKNITASNLHFRTFIREPDYEQNDDGGVAYVYGIRNEEKDLNQNIGYVRCKQGKCIAFPNIYQHKVAPFELKDKSIPGIRKILVFFLVDPTIRVKSTSTVLPQQEGWQFEELLKLPEFETLPVEILDLIFSYANPMTVDKARFYRNELMKERKYFVDEHNKVMFEREVSLCEH